MQWRMWDAAIPKRVAILVSRQDHCLLDLLWRWRRGQLEMDVALVVSNHADLREDVESFGLPFAHIPVDAASTSATAEQRLLELLRGERVDLVVLARYMQILSGELLDALGAPAINIHHSFLPAFAGASPYEQAKQRGVKLIGATAHYVTEGLDEGPIIEQDTVRVTHRDDVAALMAPRRRHRAHGARARRAVALRRPRAARGRDDRRVLSDACRCDRGLYFSHPSSLEHDPRALMPGHPDTPERLIAIERLLGAERLAGLGAPRGAGRARALARARARARADRADRAPGRAPAAERSTWTRSSARPPIAPRCTPPAAPARWSARCSPASRSSASRRCARPAITPSPIARWASACSTAPPSPRRWRSPSSARGAC